MQMANDEHPTEIEGFLQDVRAAERYLRNGRYSRERFSRNLFQRLVGRSVDMTEAVWNPTLDSLSRDLLQVLSDYAESTYKPINYEQEPSFLGGCYKIGGEHYVKRKAKISSALRRLHEEIERRLRCDSNPSV
jgi:hypothetical protein